MSFTPEELKRNTEIAIKGRRMLSGTEIIALRNANRAYKLKLGRRSVDREKLKKLVKGDKRK